LQQGCATGKFWLFCIFCFSFSHWINAKEPKCGLAKHRLSVRLYFAMSIVRSALVAYNVLQIAEGGAFLHNLNSEHCSSILLKICQTEKSRPAFGNVLLSDALLSGYVCFDVIFVFCMLFCVDKKIKKEGRKKFCWVAKNKALLLFLLRILC